MTRITELPVPTDKTSAFQSIANFERDGVRSKRERQIAENWLSKLSDSDRVEDKQITKAISQWQNFVDLASSPTPVKSSFLKKKNFDVNIARYRRNVEILAGERDAILQNKDGTSSKVRFTDRYVPSKTHQLDQVLKWLCQTYDRLKLPYELQPVIWRGRKYYNLVVTIQGTSNNTVSLCDHYDAADKEPGVSRNKKQLVKNFGFTPKEVKTLEGTIPIGASVPGANDNGSATAALIELGHLLKAKIDQKTRFKNTIQLVHLVGEEMPANSVGAKTYLRHAKEAGRPIVASIVLDMIGCDRRKTRKAQLSTGRGEGSIAIAAQCEQAKRDLGLNLKTVLRPKGSRLSYLHQTDGETFDRAKIPVVAINQLLNETYDFWAPNYHSEFDLTKAMDFDYAKDMIRMALETVYRIAEPIT